MDKQLSLISSVPLTKIEQSTFIAGAVEEILSGNVDPLECDMRLKILFDVIEAIRKNEKVKEYTLEEASKYEKTFDLRGCKVTLSSKTTKDYTGCGDALMNALLEHQEVLKKQIKARQLTIDSGIDASTGEVLNPPTSSTSNFLTYKFV